VTTAAAGVAAEKRVAGDRLLFSDLQQSIEYAVSWQELEGWLARASIAHRKGALSTAQVEDLVERAIEVSRTIPES
jgi:hypothetical protein